jgi:5S rRNA maturation endonuclease (ribonuclease M5)
MKNDLEKLKKSVSEWVITLDSKQYNIQEKLKEIEERISNLEDLHGKPLKGDFNEFQG